MMPRAAALAFCLVAPVSVAAQAPVTMPPPAAPSAAPSPDSLARHARADSLARFYLAYPESLPRRSHAESTRLRETIVRVPAGTPPPPPGAPGPGADTTAATSRAGGPEQRIFLVGGIAFPLAPPDLSSGWNPGAALGGGLEFLLEPRFGVRLGAEWSALPFDERRYLRSQGLYGSGQTIDGGATNLVMASLALKFHTRSTWPRFYASAGPGFGMLRVSEALLYDPAGLTVARAEGETRFKGGMTAGAGVEFLRADGSGMFLDLHWNALFTSGEATQYMPLRIGLVFP